MLVNIFTSRTAALQTIGDFPAEYRAEDLKPLAQLHAIYFRDAAHHEEYLEIRPVLVWPSGGEGPLTTRINLPVSTMPHCHVELAGRCVVSLADIGYPEAR